MSGEVELGASRPGIQFKVSRWRLESIVCQKFGAQMLQHTLAPARATHAGKGPVHCGCEDESEAL